MSRPRVVIIGAGIVGANLADELVGRGWTDITVVEQGPLPPRWLHLPRPRSGLPDQPVPLDGLVRRVHRAEVPGAVGRRPSCFNQVGGLEVATTPARLEDLKRKHGWAQSWGIDARLVDADECVRLTRCWTATRSSAATTRPPTGSRWRRERCSC